MPALSDVRFDALRAAGHTGSTSDMLLQWLQAGGATSPAIPDAWREYLDAAGFTTGHRNDDWFEYLGSLGHTGSLNDREMAFWLAEGGGGLGPELMVNGDFSSATGWVVNPNWVISGGTATNAGTAGFESIQQDTGLAVLGTCTIVIDIASISGTLDLRFGAVTGPSKVFSTTTPGVHEIDAAPIGVNGATVWVTLLPTGAAQSFDLNSISIKEVL